MMVKIIRYLYRINSISFILIGLIILIFTSFIISLLVPEGSFRNPVAESFAKDGPLTLFLFACVFAPFVETFLMQYLPFLLANLLFKHKIRLFFYLITASLFFGYMHDYNIFYSLTGCFIGFILCFFFYIAKQRKQSAIILVTIIHGLNNLLALLITTYG